MKLYITIFTLNIVLSTSAEYVHEAFEYVACSDAMEEFFFGYDGEELWHADFKQKRGVVTFPDFTELATYPELYDISVDEIAECKHYLSFLFNTFKGLPTEEDAPQTSIYPKNSVHLSVQNTLICHVTGFYPPSVNILWTKNDANVTEGISLSQYRPRTDVTFNIFSTLKFTPAEGDIYSCTVNHEALQGKPQTKTWSVDVALPSVGPAVFCGLGLTIGVLGVATGTFFLFKGNKSN